MGLLSITSARDFEVEAVLGQCNRARREREIW